jgi:hypothetical protein
VKKLLLALVAALLIAPALSAQSAPTASSASPHEQLYAAFDAGIDQDAVTDRALAAVGRQMLAVPQIAAVEERHPGTVATLLARARPIVLTHSDRVHAQYYPRMISLLRAELTIEEATDLVDFYTSPLGRRLLLASSVNTRADTVVGAAVEDQSVTGADVQADLEATGRATLNSLSAAETAQLYREIAARPALAKLTPMMPKLAALRAQMESEPLSAQEQAALNTVLEAVLGPLLE